MADDVKFRDAAGNCKPSVTVTDYYGYKLVYNKDYYYELSYYDSKEPIDPKKDKVPENTLVSVNFYPMGNYEFKKSTASESIVIMVYGEDRNIANANIVLKDRSYNGKKALVESDEDFETATFNGRVLKLDTWENEGDFWVYSYSNNDRVGTAKVTLVGCGDYAGTKTVTFKIKKTQLGN